MSSKSQLKKLLRELTKNFFLFIIYFYQGTFSLLFGGSCRFQPTCSVYAKTAIENHSLKKALILIVKRLGKCHPLGGKGYDPVPESQK